LTHLHWDHTQGLPFFSPLQHPDAELDVYGPAQDDGSSVADVFAASIRPPLFPVEVSEFPGTVRFHDTGDSNFGIDGWNVMARYVPHVGPTLGFRVEWQGRSVAYLSDHQQPLDGSHAATQGALDLVRNVDVLIHDSQYTPDEFAKKHNWGHCTTDYAVWLAVVAGAKQLVLFHHDPMRSDDSLDHMAERVGGPMFEIGRQVVVAREGATLTLP
jgi:phosphoribosyl 1,2-cyclic phosphodiesterase